MFNISLLSYHNSGQNAGGGDHNDIYKWQQCQHLSWVSYLAMQFIQRDQSEEHLKFRFMLITVDF